MKKFEYDICKIASNQKLIIELLETKTLLNKVQHQKFCILFNETQKLMFETTINFLILKNRKKQLEKITVKPYNHDVVRIVRKSLLELRKELNFTFEKKYIDFINTDNY